MNDVNGMFDRTAAELGLPTSRLISMSKSGYRERHPDNAVVFNATIADAMGTRRWWGDVDLTVDESMLVELAEHIGVDPYLFVEGDSRKGFVLSINPANAVVYITDEGLVNLGMRIPLTRCGRPEHRRPPKRTRAWRQDGKRSRMIRAQCRFGQVLAGACA